MSEDNIIRNKLQDYYTSKFPDALVSDFASISTGWESDVYTFHLHYTENGQVQDMSLVLRIYPGDDAIEKSAREYAGMRQLHAVGYSVPQVFLREEAKSPFDKPFIIMEKIDGEILWSFLDNATPERRKRLLTLFCEKFVQLHQLDWRPFADDPVRYEPGDGFVNINNILALFRGFLEQFQQQGFLPCIDWVDKRKQDILCHRPSVIHLDYHAANALLREVNGVSELSIIDWTSIMVTDYRLDLAWTLLLMGSFGNPEYRDIILDEYTRIAGQPVEHIELFDVLVCVRRLFSMVIPLTLGAEKLGMRPEAVATIKQQKDHFQAVYSHLQAITGLTVPEAEIALEIMST